MNTIEITRALGLGAVAALVAATLPALSASAAPTSSAVSLVATSHDGAAFDLDEYADGDVTVQVVGADKQPVDVDDQVLSYSWDAKPFSPNASAAGGSGTQEIETDGSFVVPLPTHGISGTYVLTAGLGPDASSANAVSSAVRLTVKVGQASVTFTDASPLRAVAGATRTIIGALRLADGTPLPHRQVDLGLERGTAGSDPVADAGFVPAPGQAPVEDFQVTTDAKGAFSATLSDPTESVQGTELGGSIEAETVITPDIGNAASSSSLDVDFVGTTAPVGSTAVLDDLGGAMPGQALFSTLTVTAPDDTFKADDDDEREPVEGQVYTLTVDRGFFTTGEGKLPSAAGAPAGDLVSLGTTLTGVTDANGQVTFNVGIARDKGFDDDGRVTATVKAVAGGPSGTTTASWDTINSLNGRVAVTLSPRNEQDGPVNPTVVADRTYYDIFTLDQFGNRIGGKPVDLTFSGNTDALDYSEDFAESDFDTRGDIWVRSDEVATFKITGTWVEAPTSLYVDAQGTAITGVADVQGSASISYYAVNFNASKFTIRSSATDVVKKGTAVTQTVRVVDQRGNPVRDNLVRFFRVGPDKVRSDAVATRTTNARGEASYTFVGTKLGRGKITAEISDGSSRRIRHQTVVFGATIKARLTKGKNGAGADRLAVSTKSLAAGARVQLYRVTDGKRRLVGIKRLSRAGKAEFKIRDRNRKKFTTYVALVRSTSKTVADQSNSARIR